MQASSTQTHGGAERPGSDREKTTPAPGDTPEKDDAQPERVPPDAIPDLMPGVDPQQTPGVDRPPAESD